MATRRARAKDILTAIRDTAPDDGLLNRTVEAFALAYRGDEDPATMTQEQKFGKFLRGVRGFVRETVHGVEVQVAQAEARKTVVPPDLGED